MMFKVNFFGNEITDDQNSTLLCGAKKSSKVDMTP